MLVVFYVCLMINGNFLGWFYVLFFDRVIIDIWEGYIWYCGFYRIFVIGVYVIIWVIFVVGNILLELVING